MVHCFICGRGGFSCAPANRLMFENKGVEDGLGCRTVCPTKSAKTAEQTNKNGPLKICSVESSVHGKSGEVEL